jgi:glutamate 5-kinase
MQTWLELFSLFDLHVGQMLLARADFSDLKKQNAARETLASMLQHSIIPIINENDLWDNDNLAAVVAKLIQADTVILLTDQEGLYTADPRIDPRATLIAKVEHIDAEILSFATGASSSLGIGGMATKIEAAQAAAQSGIRTIIAPSYRPNVLIDLLEGKQIGTVFMEEKR